MRKPLFVLLLAAAPAWAQPDANSVQVEQLGSGSVSVLQSGERNTVSIRQQGPAQDYQNNVLDAHISQYGRANDAIVSQGGQDLGVTTNADVSQNGERNRADFNQSGQENDIKLDQQGKDNAEVHRQRGSINRMTRVDNRTKTILQNGDGSKVVE